MVEKKLKRERIIKKENMKTLKKLLPFIIYLTGCLTAYPVLKISMMENLKPYHIGWSVGDRASCLLLSLFSWMSVGVGIFAYSTAQIDFNKPAKW